jgi:hypothetical protein
MADLCDVAPRSLVEIATMLDAASISETPVDFYQTSLHNIPEDIFIVVAARG